jgi:lactoylglutathione lyase
MTTFTHDHIHLRSRNPDETAKYYVRMFGAEMLDSAYTDGEKRIAFVLCGLNFFIAPVRSQKVADGPVAPNLGIDHLSFGVKDVDKVAAELKQKGAKFTMEPETLRPGVRVAYIQGPENVCIEIIDRSAG